MYTIYGLIDPRTRLVRYIGMTAYHPSERLVGHIKKANKGDDKAEWIKELKRLGTRPDLIILEYAPDEQNARKKEREWIEKGKMIGWHLLNTSSEVKINGREPVIQKRNLRKVIPAHKWHKFTNDWFSANAHYIAEPHGGISALARAMADHEGADSHEPYKSTAKKYFDAFRAEVNAWMKQTTKD